MFYFEILMVFFVIVGGHNQLQLGKYVVFYLCALGGKTYINLILAAVCVKCQMFLSRYPVHSVVLLTKSLELINLWTSFTRIYKNRPLLESQHSDWITDGPCCFYDYVMFFLLNTRFENLRYILMGKNKLVGRSRRYDWLNLCFVVMQKIYFHFI